MAILLSLESSTTVCSAALHENDTLLVTREVHTPQAAASQLTPLIDALFTESGILKSQLRAVAVSGGPGSYTGLRIATATAKGICYALGIPLITLDSLHVLASSIEPVGNGSLMCPMIDARRMEVYCCLLTGSFEEVEPTRPLVIDEHSFAGQLEKHSIVFFGNGATKCEEVIRHPHAMFIKKAYPRASAMGKMAFRKFESGDFADVRTYEPAYLKEFVAKTKKV
jgi:tRNA threonylcarbamoyladenosine biosynthesis protein TsaB